MFRNVKESTIAVGNSTMDVVSFGRGKRSMVILPGLTVRGVKGAGLMLAWMYRRFTKEWRVYVLDKKADIPEGCTIAALAEDAAEAMQTLGIRQADIFGVSQGGIIAQYLAADHPELVEKLVLGVTLSRSNPVVEQTVRNWK